MGEYYELRGAAVGVVFLLTWTLLFGGSAAWAYHQARAARSRGVTPSL